MMRRLTIGAALACAAIHGHGQATNPGDGNWVGTMAGQKGGELGVEMTLAGADGTWRMAPPTGKQGRNNPCLGKTFPVKVAAASPTEIKLEIDGASVLTGCLEQSATLSFTSAGGLEGRLDDGRALKFARP